LLANIATCIDHFEPSMIMPIITNYSSIGEAAW